jgi:hypothetical protein
LFKKKILRDYKDLSYWFEDTNSKGGDQRQSEPVVGWGKEETGEEERAAVLFVIQLDGLLVASGYLYVVALASGGLLGPSPS